MLKLTILMLIQTLLLTASQVTLKVAMTQMEKFCWQWNWFRSQLTNWPLLASGVCITAATILWMYVLKHYAFSQCYPLVAISYVWGVAAAMIIFHENVPLVRIFGVFFIIVGVVCIVSK